MTKEEWLAERNTGIGGSDVAAILGLSPFQTSVSVWLRKTGRGGITPETEPMRIGTELEDFVARRYSEETGRKVQRYTHMIHVGCHLGNVDRLVCPQGSAIASFKKEIRTDRLLECKTSRSDWYGAVPAYYVAQVLHYMGLIPEIMYADVACEFYGTRLGFEVFPSIERNQSLIDTMFAKEEEWWDKHVIHDIPPEPASEKDCRDLWHNAPKKTIVVFANDETIGKVARIKEIKREIDALTAEQEALSVDVMSEIKDGNTLKDASNNVLATWNPVKGRATTSWKAIAEELGASQELIEKHTKQGEPSRRFTVK